MCQFENSEDTYRTIFNAANDAIIIHDINDGRVLDVNHKMLEMYGYTREEALCLDICKVSEGVSPYSQVEATGWIQKAIDGGPQLFEWKAKRKTGEAFWVEVNLKRLITSSGKEQLLAIVRDITERKLAEKAILDERNKIKSYLDTASTIMLALDSNANVSLINKKGCEVIGCDKEEIIGKNWFNNFLPENKRSEIKCIFDELINGAQADHGIVENLIKTRHGEEKIIKWHNTVLKDTDEKITGAFSCGEDITQQRQIEDQLRQSQKMEAIGTLAGGIAHDFNNILAGIIGYAEVAKDEIADGLPVGDYFDDILKLSNRAKDLTQQILTFSRKSAQESGPIQLQPVLKEGLKMLRSTIPRTIDIQQNINPKCSPVIANPTQMHQLIMNLCTNAADEMLDSGGELEVMLDEIEIMERTISYDCTINPGQYV